VLNPTNTLITFQSRFKVSLSNDQELALRLTLAISSPGVYDIHNVSFLSATDVVVPATTSSSLNLSSALVVQPVLPPL
jgi:hypothetical protein